MAAELSPRIRVNAVLPGAIETDALRGCLDRFGPEVREHMIAQPRCGVTASLRTSPTPRSFCLSAASSFVTGKLLVVDGAASGGLMPREMPDLTAP